LRAGDGWQSSDGNCVYHLYVFYCVSVC
jgi:hypothetical protein